LVANQWLHPLLLIKKLKKEDATLYRSFVGNLQYLTTVRPDIMFAASLQSRFIHSPSHFHFAATKRVLRYIQGTITYGIRYCSNFMVKLFGYCDSDWGRSIGNIKSTLGYVFSLGSCVFSWSSKKQQSIARSSGEAKYVSIAIATSQAIWLKRILENLT
jgi:hypothetical protein